MNSGRAAWCSHCGKDCDTYHDHTINITSCVDCGKVLSEGAYFESPRRPFQKGNVANFEISYKKAKVSHTSRLNKVFERGDTLWCSHCVRKGGTVHEHTTASICCVDCGKKILKDVYTEKATIYRHALSRKDKKKLKLALEDAKSMRSTQTAAEGVGQLHMKKIAASCSYASKKEPTNESLITEDEEDSEQESCSYVYNYDYDAGDEYD